MSTRKTSVEINEELLTAVQSRMLLEAINRSLEGMPDEAESVRRMRGIQRKRVEGQW